MLLFAVSYFAGMLTIVSPCILPVLPFVFARAEQPFLRSGLPMLAGMAFTFAGAATLAAVGGSWAVEANEYGRLAAIVLLAVFGLTLLVPELAEWMTRPLVAAGARLSQSIGQGGPQRDAAVLPSFLLGIATGLLWAPCAGPILGLVLTGAALEGASAGTSLLLLAYAAGAATSLALALLAGGRVFAAMKRSLGAGEWIRRGLGAAVLVGVAVIALGLDTGFLTRISATTTAALEQELLDRTGAVISGPGDRAPSAVEMTDAAGATMAPRQAQAALPVEGALPPLAGAVKWLNSPPLTAEGLRGKVVVVSFWTYSCINCLRAIPYVRAWAKTYRDQGLVVIGVHTPEFAFEKKIANVEKAVTALQVDYPVAIDNDFAIWRAFFNHYWPALYVVDPKGQIRYHHFGEGEYARGEQVIRQLLAEAGQSVPREGSVAVKASGVEAASDVSAVGSPETYLGLAKRRISSRPAACCGMGAIAMTRRRRGSTSGPSQGSGRSAKSRPCSMARPEASSIASARATFISCSARPTPKSRSASGCGSTAPCPARTMAPTSRPMAPARSPTIASTSWCAKAAPSWTIRSRSNSSIPVFKPSPSPSVDWETSHDRT